MTYHPISNTQMEHEDSTEQIYSNISLPLGVS